MELLADVLWNLVLDHLEIVLVSVEDRSTVYAKHTIGSDIVFNILMVLLGDEAQVEAPFSPFGDRCAACVERTIGLEIILDAPDGTPR